MEINLSVQNAETGQSKPSITPLQQYLLRPLALAFLCWYEYLQNYEIVKQPRGTKRKNANSTDGNLSDSSDDSTDDFSLRERYFLNPEHPDYSKLMVIPRKQPAVVQYHGFALKPSRRRTTEEHDEQYAMSALVMFFPFLHPDDLLKDGYQSNCFPASTVRYSTYYESMFDDGEKIRSGKISDVGLVVLAHNEDRWESKFMAQERAKEHFLKMKVLAEEISHEHSNTCCNVNLYDDSSESDDDVGYDDVYSTNDLLLHSTPNQAADINCNLTNLNIPIQPPLHHAFNFDRVHSTREIFEGFKTPSFQSSTNILDGQIFPFISSPSVTVVEINELAVAAIASLEIMHVNRSNYSALRTNKLQMQSTTAVEIQVKPTMDKVEVPVYASLHEIASVFGYTKDQTRAFRIVAAGLLNSIVDDMHDVDFSDSYVANRQSALLMEGLAGSGKSYVISGWKALSISWGYPHAVTTFAITGIAASLVHGRTIASMFLKKANAFKPIKLACIDEVKIASCFHMSLSCSNLPILIQVYMAGGKQLAEFELLFRKNCSHPSLIFGGINIVLIGDPAQLPPIGDQALYDVAQRTLLGEEGYKLYNSIADANTVILDKNKRTPDDKYSQFQVNIRNGKFTKNMIDTLNALDNKNITQEDGAYVPIIATKNATLKALYEEKSKLIAQQLTRQQMEPPILLLADIKSAIARRQRDDEVTCPLEQTRKKIRRKKKKPAPLTEAEVRYLDRLPDKSFDNFPMAFFLYYGASGMIATNLGVEYQLANGTRGEIVGWQFPEGTTFKRSLYHGVPVRIPMLNDMQVAVDLIYFKVTSYLLTTTPPGQPPGLDKNVICIPRMNYTVNKAIMLPCNAVSSKRLSVGIEITQIPIRTADVLTQYNSQGSQYDQYVIWDLEPKSFYQVFSRGKKGLESIILNEKITPEFAAKVMSRTSFNDEIKRLKPLHNETKRRLAK